MTIPSLLSLPEELLLNIFSHIPPYQLQAVAASCHMLQRIAEEECLWRRPIRDAYQITEQVLALFTINSYSFDNYSCSGAIAALHGRRLHMWRYRVNKRANKSSLMAREAGIPWPKNFSYYSVQALYVSCSSNVRVYLGDIQGNIYFFSQKFAHKTCKGNYRPSLPFSVHKYHTAAISTIKIGTKFSHSAAMDGSICRWTTRTGRIQQRLLTQTSGVTSLLLFGKEREGRRRILVSGSLDGTLCIHNNPPNSLKGDLFPIVALESDQRDTLFSSHLYSAIKVWSGCYAYHHQRQQLTVTLLITIPLPNVYATTLLYSPAYDIDHTNRSKEREIEERSLLYVGMNSGDMEIFSVTYGQNNKISNNNAMLNLQQQFHCYHSDTRSKNSAQALFLGNKSSVAEETLYLLYPTVMEIVKIDKAAKNIVCTKKMGVTY